ncbi:flavonoid 3'-monooxygenase [Artemisia annua]|uniref:Flavonoid 3'-monooxygenase n=1 Tax=Artemisia annua TaxID=35608 RepID=A0A2U1QGL5_ARTAN|nr:flavonoid 3'-monooxygenase [Artemisia annua]
MEQYSIDSYVVAWLAIVAIFLVARYLRRPTSKLKLPPGPKPWPIIGNLNLMGTLPHRSVRELSKQYGPIMHLKFGSKSVVVGSSVEMAKVFLKTMGANFACRPKTAAGKYTAYNYSDITWSPYGAYWRQARKLCAVELFGAKRLESYKYIRVEEIKSLIKEVYKSSGEEIVLKELLATLSLNVISRMRMKAVSKKFDPFLEHVLDEHDARRRLEAENFVPMDMVDLLLQVGDDSTLDVKLERHRVKGFTQLLFAES